MKPASTSQRADDESQSRRIMKRFIIAYAMLEAALIAWAILPVHLQ